MLKLNSIQLRNKLIKDTLDFAIKNSLYYSTKYSSFDNETIVDNFHKLPFIVKEDINPNLESLLTDSSFPARISMSSGTTIEGNISLPTLVMQNQNEIDLFESLKEYLNSDSKENLIGIRLISVNHGRPSDRLLPGFFDMPLIFPFHYNQVVELLLKKFSYKDFSNRVNVIIGSIRALKHLAILILEKNKELIGQFELDVIYSYSDVLTLRWRELLEKVFKCKVRDIYGMSEVIGSTCVECDSCGMFHFQEIVHPEVISLKNSNDIIDEGIGELVLTSLYPFTQMLPLIRYRTGDLIEVNNNCKSTKGIAFKIIGRKKFSIIFKGELILPSIYLYELMDGIPDVSRIPSLGLERFEIENILGAPKYSIKVDIKKDDILTLYLDIELNYNVFLHEERIEYLKNKLIKHIPLATDSSKKLFSLKKYVIVFNFHSINTLKIVSKFAH